MAQEEVLFIVKWYPNRYDVQLGTFIQKQVEGISKQIPVRVFYAAAAPVNESEVVFRQNGHASECIYYYPQNTSAISFLINGWRYLQTFRKFYSENYQKKNSKPLVTVAYILLRPAVIAYLLRVRFKIPFIISEQWSGYASGKFFKMPFWKKRMYRYFLRIADARVAVSEYLRNCMKKAGIQEHITVIPNTVSAQPISSVDEKYKPVNLLVVADLVDDIKNISGVLEAFNLLLNDDPALHLTIAGGGRDENMLKEKAAQSGIDLRNIIWTGRMTNPEILQLLKRNDLLIVNSRVETFSLIGVEAMSCGKPVVATRCGGPEAYVTEESGILIQPDSTTELIHAIRYILDNYSKFNPEKIRALVVKKFSPEAVGTAYTALFRAICK
ncbi:MAG: glycosyltransferase [Bacteroidia bacterium]|nr:glycosyltransferase [Bacteroidia bacterium]